MKTRPAAIVTLLGIAVTGCSISTAPDEAALEYNAGPFTDTSFSNCVPAGTRQMRGPGDKGYTYPAGQRTAEFSGSKGADFGPISVVSSDNITMSVSGVATFALNTECKTLRDFHERIGLKYEDNWDGLLGTYLKQPLDKALDAASKEYGYRELYTNPGVKEKWEARVGALAATYVEDQAGGEYFCAPGFKPGAECGDLTLTIQAPQPPEAIVAAFNEVEAARQENVAQQSRNTTAQTASLGLVKALRELGMPVNPQTLDAYTRWLAVERGKASIVVIPQGNDVAVTP